MQNAQITVPAVVTLVLGMGSINFLFVAYTSYRSEDFVKANETPDFATKGTCVESVTHGVLGVLGDVDCANGGERAARLLLSQTHAIYYLHSTAPSPEVTAVALTLMASTIGRDSMSINTSMANNVLAMLDDEGVTIPRDCSSIYTNATSTSYETSRQRLPAITCDATLTGSNDTSFNSTEWGELLYACETQFHFGSSGPHKDTYGIPLLNEPSGPSFYPWPGTTGFNSASPWSVKSRMFLGLRFGWSLWAYVPSMLSLGYMTADAAMVLLIETTRPAKESRETERTPHYHNERNTRVVFSSLMVANSIFWMFAAAWVPWGLDASLRLRRPVCDEGGARGFYATLAYLFYTKKTRGGWEWDAPCLFLEMFVMASQIIMLVTLPIARVCCLSKGDPESDGATGGENGKDVKNANKENTELVITRGAIYYADALENGTYSRKVFVGATVLGLVVLTIGNAYAGTMFGNAWARAVGDELVPWSESVLATYIYDLNMWTLVSSLASGLVLGVVTGRWTIEDNSRESMQAFFVWIVFALGAFVPMVTLSSMNYFTGKDKQVAECEIFPAGGDFDSERNSCKYRSWSVIIGTALLAGVVVLVSVYGIIKALLARNLNSKKTDEDEVTTSLVDVKTYSITPQKRFKFTLDPSRILPRNNPR
jgi:hypothetical protein